MKRKAFRRKVYDRDRGVCAECKRDTESIRRKFKTLSTFDARKKAAHFLRELGFNVDGTQLLPLWEADHVDSIDEGGKDAVENVQTLCVPCHKEKTGEHRGRKARRRRLVGRKAINLP